MSSSATSCSKCQINFSCEVTWEFHQLMFHYESDDELKSHVHLDPLLTETSHQDVGEQVPSSQPNPCEESQNDIDDFDWTTFNEVLSTVLDCELESFIGLDLLLSEHQDVHKNLGEQVLATETYFCEESLNEIDDFDWTTFNEFPSIEAYCGLESHIYPDSQLTKHQNVQEHVDEQILTTVPNPCQESQIKSDDFHQTSFIQVPRTEISCDQEQNEHHKTVQKKFCKEGKDHKCNVCQKTFIQQRHLKTHVKTVHDKQREFECGVCQKTFSSKAYVKIHKKLIHDKQKDYECDVCQKTFTQQRHLKTHVKTVHDKQREFECGVCQKTFSSKAYVKIHKKLIHDKQKDYKCDVFQKKFSGKGHLKIHKKTVHDKQKDYECDDYECDVCQKRFSRKSIVTKHKKIVHDKRKDYECDECHKVFSEQGNLKQHKNAVHEGQKNFECGACQKKFTLQQYLKKHIIIVHDK
ncbi:zinc finger protein 39-like [Trichogramma pretiosum]|uniref:zinc finger protein 39-like n=1 Tax=Trichogramma pretiosum TaxID=7493 RepID=UPI000C719526|nr:zinc finger protein 39-like [Trichogramma pretiosum]